MNKLKGEIQDKINFLGNENTCSITNHLNSHDCVYHAFVFESEKCVIMFRVADQENFFLRTTLKSPLKGKVGSLW